MPLVSIAHFTNTRPKRNIAYTSRNEAGLLPSRRLVQPTPREEYIHFLFQTSNLFHTRAPLNSNDATFRYVGRAYVLCLHEKSRFSSLRRVKKKIQHRTSLVRKHSRQTATHGYGPPPRSAILDRVRPTSDRTVSIASVATLLPCERTATNLVPVQYCALFFNERDI